MSHLQTIQLKDTQTGNMLTVKLDPDFQMRTKESPQAIEDYRKALLEGSIKEPLEAVEYTKASTPTYRLVSGFHRAKAYLSLPEGHSVKPMEVTVVARSSDYTELKQAAAIHGAKSNLNHGVRFTEDDRKNTAVYLVKNTMMSVKDIAEAVGKPKRTVDRWVKEAMAEKRKLSICAIWRNAQMNPNASIASLMASDGYFLSRALVTLCRDLYKYYGDETVQQWIDKGFPMSYKGESVEDFYARELQEVEVKPQTQSTSSQTGTSGTPKGNSLVETQKIPQESREVPVENQNRHLSDSAGELVDYEALAHRYANLELTIEDMQTMLDKGIYEEVKKVARKQAKGAVRIATQRLQEELNETRESLGETSQKLNRVTREKEELADRIAELEKQVTMINREVDTDAPVKLPGDSKQVPDLLSESQVKPIGSNGEDLGDLMGFSVKELLAMKRSTKGAEKRRIQHALEKKVGGQ